MNGSLGVRKGAWTGEEDELLRKYVEKYGERKWYQVPLIAECVRVIKPRPRLLSKNSPLMKNEYSLIGNSIQPGYDLCKKPLDPHNNNENTLWWESLLSTGNEFDEVAGTSGNEMEVNRTFNETIEDGFWINDLSLQDLNIWNL
ncbi:hypothetical protein Patl1_25743 [Pistacia atlantica]|uniref:Uncharacterized protein n=1 Tax=Pistacia atlantica TaxID=434234 RepID=A0ACC1B4N6_9ROSI|nr:hypothetical protein Patl1_25743 [Pistacia atlantica]